MLGFIQNKDKFLEQKVDWLPGAGRGGGTGKNESDSLMDIGFFWEYYKCSKIMVMIASPAKH